MWPFCRWLKTSSIIRIISERASLSVNGHAMIIRAQLETVRRALTLVYEASFIISRDFPRFLLCPATTTIANHVNDAQLIKGLAL